MDRRETVQVFRKNLSEVIERSGLSRSAFAAKLGLDRSTLSQLLSPDIQRLPRAETIAAIATSEQVSVDWLLGLSQEGQLGLDLVGPELEIEPGAGSPADERLQRWHAEAAGYKIRYVPATLPDLLKSEEVIDFEYRHHGSAVPQVRLQQAEERLAYSRRPETDMEVCTSFQSVEEFARGEGIWRALPVEIRRLQIGSMIRLIEELYPTFRWFLFDGLQRYCPPMTVFGPQRVAVYFGNMYVVFNSTEHIREMTRHFDGLIRAAVVQPTDMAAFLKSLLEELCQGDEEPGGSVGVSHGEG
jgi:transcriptional regulator with XRE-family HTH domain